MRPHRPTSIQEMGLRSALAAEGRFRHARSTGRTVEALPASRGPCASLSTGAGERLQGQEGVVPGRGVLSAWDGLEKAPVFESGRMRPPVG